MNRQALEILQEMCVYREAAGNKLEGKDWGRNEYGDVAVACLAGWATLEPGLRELGLRSLNDHWRYREDRGILRPFFEGSVGYTALGKLFDLGFKQRAYLFAQSGGSSWSDARERIQNVLKGEI